MDEVEYSSKSVCNYKFTYWTCFALQVVFPDAEWQAAFQFHRYSPAFYQIPSQDGFEELPQLLYFSTASRIITIS